MRRFSFAIAVSSLFLTVSSAQAVHPADRVRAVPDDNRTVKLTGNHSPLARAEYDAGAADPGLRMDKIILALNPGEEQQRALEALMVAQQNPASPEYRKWLTPEAFADQFGVSQNDVVQITRWLGAHGFTIDEVPAGRRAIVFSGTARMVQSAFHTQIREYNVNGELHYANATDPEIPEALAPVVLGTVTLHDFARKSMRTPALAVPDFNDGGTYYLAPADFATIYNLTPLYTAGTDGTGQTVAIVARTNITLSDVTTFRSYFGLSVNNPQIILNGANPGITADVEEALLDVEWSGAVAKGATVKMVVSASTNSTDGVDLSAQYIVSNNLAHVMSTSYGSCEAAMGSSEMGFYSNLWQQASAQGISAMVSAGDSGAAGCDAASAATAVDGRAVNGLCSSVYSVCVGGTEFEDSSNYSTYWLSSMNATTKESAISYIPEMAWNQSGSVSGGSDLWAGGGGASVYYAKPLWQSGPGVPADGKRDVPDVSLSAATHDAYLIVYNGELYAVGGTSAASPSFAGIMALVDQQTDSAQGNPNSTLYALAALQGTTQHAYFHDVTSGSNTVPGVTGYNAGAGYDLATGLGSVNGTMLVDYWGDTSVVSPAPSMKVSMSAGALTIGQGGSATSAASVVVGGGFSNAVTLSVSGAPAGVTATLASGSLAAPGSGSSVLTIAAGTAAIAGTATLTVTATGGGLTSTASVVVTIVPAFALTKNATSISLQQDASAAFTLTSTSAGGFSGAVVLTASLTGGGALPAGVTVGFAPSTIAAPGSGTSLVTVSASYAAVAAPLSITIKGTSGSLTNTVVIPVTVTAKPVGSFTLTAAPSSVSVTPGGSASTTITVTPGSSFTASVALSTGSLPAGITVQFSSSSINRGGTSTFTARVANSVAAGSYPITVIGTSSGVSPAPTVVVTVVVGGFKLTAGSVSATLARSSIVAIALGTTASSGFAGALKLTVTGLPPGVTALFTPPTIANPTAGASSLRLTASAAAQEGVRTITIVATSASGAVETAAVSLMVY